MGFLIGMSDKTMNGENCEEDFLTKIKLEEYFFKAERMQYYWKLGNDILYDMCKKYPFHIEETEVIAKVWLIGRSYAAAIERGAIDKDGKENTELIYESILPEVFSEYNNKIDDSLSKTNSSDLKQIFSTYDLVLECFNKISNKWNRSLTSKYLHFHKPENYYLMDSRAKTGLKNVLEALSINSPLKRSDIMNYPILHKESEDYIRFYLKCQKCHKVLEEEFNRKLSKRDFDNLLLVIADDIALKKK